jgi:hypothetical protein
MKGWWWVYLLCCWSIKLQVYHNKHPSAIGRIVHGCLRSRESGQLQV